MNDHGDAAPSYKFDSLTLQREVLSLCKVGFRRDPLNSERVKAWVRQFEGEREKALAWLILRHMVYRTTPQLQSSIRQALKQAALYFLREAKGHATSEWKSALEGKNTTLRFRCGPPAFQNPDSRGKSGDIVTRLINREYGVEKWSVDAVDVLESDERYLLVDDGAYTGMQLFNFLSSWKAASKPQQIAIVVAVAHRSAIDVLAKNFPEVRLFFGELLTEKNCLHSLSDQWINAGQWPYTESPRKVYLELCERSGPFKEHLPEGFGKLGVMVGFEHGVPDDSLLLLWGRSPKWAPLIER
jgi:hypothetical protein